MVQPGLLVSMQHMSKTKITSTQPNCIKFSVQQAGNLMQFVRGADG
jgi:hypothetical protein